MTRWLVALSLCALSGCAAPLAGPAQPVAPAPQAAAFPPPVAPPPLASAEAPAPQDATPEGDGAALDDDDDGPAPSMTPPPNSPALTLSDAEINTRFHHSLASLGPASIGPPSAGALVNGVQMQQSELWQLTDPGRAWGTQETVDALQRCVERVNQRFPGTPPITIGHLSAKTGGHLNPHRSHQSGRDADVGYYYKGTTRPFIRATADNLDLVRTWALIKTALKETTVEMILVDHSVQRLLVDYAAASGEDPAFLDEVFQIRGKNARAAIRHIKGHDNHIHFRFHNPEAEAMGQRVARFVVIRRPPVAPLPKASSSPVEVATSYAPIRARSGDTLVILARRYGTTVEEIQRANGLAGNAIKAGAVYKIPQKAPPAPPKPRPSAPSRVAARKAPAKPALHTPAAVAAKPARAPGGSPSAAPSSP
jgi:penicillin-insensitive murein endopeptidase